MRIISLWFTLLLIYGTSGLTQTVTSVSNVAAMPLTPINGDIVDVAGYYLSGDGGGGRFIWDDTSEAVPDEGLVFGSGTTGRWLRQVPPGTLNVKMFGAVSGNGVAVATAIENTKRIQRALDATANGNFEVLNFLGGHYELGRTIIQTPPDGLGSAFGETVNGQVKIFRHVEKRQNWEINYYLRVGAHSSQTRPNIRLLGGGAKLKGVTPIDRANALLVIRAKFKSISVDGFTFETTSNPEGNKAGRYKGIVVLPMNASYFDDVLPEETPQSRDEATDLVAISDSTFINCREAITVPLLPARDFLTHAGSLKMFSIQGCNFLYPNGSDTTLTKATDGWPSAALLFRDWVGDLVVTDCTVDGATTGDATPTTGGNNRGPLDNFIMGGGLRNLVERNVIMHCGVEGVYFDRRHEFPFISPTPVPSTPEVTQITVQSDKSLTLRFEPLAGHEPDDIPLSLQSKLIGLKVHFVRNFGPDSRTSRDYGEYTISQILEEVYDGRVVKTGVKLESTGDPRNPSANTIIELGSNNGYSGGWDAPELFLAASEVRVRNLERIAVIRGNIFDSSPVINAATSIYDYCVPAVSIRDVRAIVTDNKFRGVPVGVSLVGHLYSEELSGDSVIDQNVFDLADYYADTHLPGMSSPESFASAALVMAARVSVTNNTIRSPTNKKVRAIYALFNCWGLRVSGNRIIAGRIISDPQLAGYGIFVENSEVNGVKMLSENDPIFLEGNTITNIDTRVGTIGGPTFGESQSGLFSDDVGSVGINLNGTLVAKFASGTYTPTGSGSPISYNSLQMTAGNEERPGYSFDGDEDTGMFWVQANVIGFASGGLEQVRIGPEGLNAYEKITSPVVETASFHLRPEPLPVGAPRSSVYVLTAQGSTSVELTLPGGAKIPIAASKSYLITAAIVGRQSGGGGRSASWKRTATVENVGGTTTLLGGNDVLHFRKDVTGFASFVDVNDATDTLKVTADGNGWSMNWVAKIELVEIGE